VTAGLGDLFGLPLAALGRGSPTAFVAGLGNGSASLLRNLSGAYRKQNDLVVERTQNKTLCLLMPASSVAMLHSVQTTLCLRKFLAALRPCMSSQCRVDADVHLRLLRRLLAPAGALAQRAGRRGRHRRRPAAAAARTHQPGRRPVAGFSRPLRRRVFRRHRHCRCARARWNQTAPSS